MTRTIRVAITQMDVKPAPTGDRLERADRLVSEVEPFGIDLVVLPELFNSGYVYSDDNFRRAETIDGPTIHWMKITARQMHMHLAGSILLQEGSDIYNAMLIVAPDGRLWRYHKSYPWGWENGYCVPNRAVGDQRTVIAETDLGDLGMMVCWDIAHPDLWRAYAGRADMMVICSSPPQFSRAVFSFPNGRTLSLDEAGPLLGQVKGAEAAVFEDMISQQTAWLQIPAACSAGAGRFESSVPQGRAFMLSMLPAAPWLAGCWGQADQIKMTANMSPACRTISADGKVLAHLPQSKGESFTVAEVSLPHKKQAPLASQPGFRAPWMSYLISDAILPRMVRPLYRKARDSILKMDAN